MMKLRLVFTVLLLLATVILSGCYTQLGYRGDSLELPVKNTFSDFEHRRHHGYYEGLAEHEVEPSAEVESEESEREHAAEEEHTAEDSEGYYGRWKPSYPRTHAYPYSYDTYWVPYPPYPYYAYPPVLYSPYYPFYGYYAPYYHYHRGYYPYTNVYRRYPVGSRYAPLSRRTYKKEDLRRDSRRSRSSRSAASRETRSDRQRARSRNKN